MEIDYRSDWAAEVRIDPLDGNAFVLQSVWRPSNGDYMVRINDIMGGHSFNIPVETWLTWELVEEERESDG
jgi:hypothetical protein